MYLDLIFCRQKLYIYILSIYSKNSDAIIKEFLGLS